MATNDGGSESIARLGSKQFLDMTANQHNGHNHAWLIAELDRLARGETTKREIFKAMGITAPILDKYIFIINLERAQNGN